MVLAPQNMFAAELVFKTSPKSQVIEVRIDPQSKQMNVVEGTIKFSGQASDGLFVKIENGQSILPIWPTPPQYDEENKSIVFVGGVPNGFSSEGLLFKLALSPAVSGDLIVAYVDGSGYLNDGKGTKESISSKSLEIYVNKDGVNEKNNDSSGINELKYAIIIVMVVAVVFVILKYGLKRKYKI